MLYTCIFGQTPSFARNYVIPGTKGCYQEVVIFIEISQKKQKKQRSEQLGKESILSIIADFPLSLYIYL